MLTRIEAFLDKYELNNKTLIVGFSGGYDSMCLLHILSKLKQKPQFAELNVVAAHFNHNWRGEEALKEQEVCKLFASSCGFEFYTKTASGIIRKTENDARIARYNFFEEVLDEYDADALLTAHNKDDNAETVLYRIIKGTGLVGLKGIAKKRGCFYRPLLTTTRAEIEEYCQENNLNPNNDSSNSDTTYRRNLIRLEILPLLESINPLVKDSLNTLAEVAMNEDSIIEEYIEMLRDKVYDDDKIISEEYKKLSVPVKKRFIYDYIQIFDLDYDYKKVNEIYDFIETNIVKRNGSTMSLATAKWLYVDDKYIETIPRRKEKSAITPSELCLAIPKDGDYKFGLRNFIIKPHDKSVVLKFPDATSTTVYADLSKIKFPLVLRNRQDGDIINPFGMSGTMKLKKYLNAKGISKHKRDELLVLADEKEVLWIVGVGISNKIAVAGIPTHVVKVM